MKTKSFGFIGGRQIASIFYRLIYRKTILGIGFESTKRSVFSHIVDTNN